MTDGVKPTRDFFARSTLQVARDLIGMQLVHRDGRHLRAGRIVETEAYLGPHDLAAHSARGRTPRTEVMYGLPGYAYVYLIYGMWHCMNVVTRAEGIPQAVLLRALEPVRGLRESAAGPGRLCRAMHIDLRLNGTDLLAGRLWIEPAAPGGTRPLIGRSPRIGVEYAGDWALRPWRFFDQRSRHLSR